MRGLPFICGFIRFLCASVRSAAGLHLAAAAAVALCARSGPTASAEDEAGPPAAGFAQRLGAALDASNIPPPLVTGAQFTLIRQFLQPQDSPYASSLSLPADGDASSTYTYGIYLGWQPLPRLQLYLDLEQFQGRGIGNATGLADLTDGDSIRSGSASLSKDPYVARKSLRYLIPLSGTYHAVARTQDQIPGDEADTQLEFKFGTLSIADDFDKNRYADSTRTQFENWGLFNNTAWDFAADTRGYTSGLMIGYEAPMWALRYGLYEMPQQANGQKLCAPITHCRGEQAELSLSPPQDAGLIVRLLAYQNLDNGGVYSEALAIAQASGTIPDIRADDRPGRRKHGFGLNLEQPLADGGDTGLFLRAGWNDGRTESFAFTEVDRVVSVGAQLSGVHWARTPDRLGLAYLIAGLSSPHEQYLAAGGQGFVVGDGRLDYGAERILEAYYNFTPLPFLSIGPDEQFIDHPGYNRSRGPANVIGLRVHLQY